MTPCRLGSTSAYFLTSVKGCLQNLFEHSHTFKEPVKRHGRNGNEER